MSVEEVDKAILGAVLERWQKTAMIIARAEATLRSSNAEPSLDEIADRIAVLAAQGRLENQGDLSLWRHSEVRLPQTL
ncbi:DUF3658 domain-containing protein [Mesorhizobium sp. ES1-3]|uniref:DUF3658 domain-containing protein n=1 Tax=Mesorhizobium sp. ES1-3 TaxID=2876628 RepID=UPI001CCA3AE1|nr:DUF3658 domain-containing protein [Mesorhizobium sp. ES1-3]MBZ9671376.1 hypothetical protein [Mesorhizobium sp. ES1-3]